MIVWHCNKSVFIYQFKCNKMGYYITTGSLKTMLSPFHLKNNFQVVCVSYWSVYFKCLGSFNTHFLESNFKRSQTHNPLPLIHSLLKEILDLPLKHPNWKKNISLYSLVCLFKKTRLTFLTWHTMTFLHGHYCKNTQLGFLFYRE